MINPDRRTVGALSETDVATETAELVAELAALFGCPPGEIEIEATPGYKVVNLRGYWDPRRTPA